MPIAPLTNTRAHATEQPPVFLYLDYNGVLNSGTRNMLDEMREFLVGLGYIKYDLRITLLSKRSGHQGRNSTLDELADAGVLDLFDNIVFTNHRTRHDHHGGTAATEHYVYDDTEEKTRRGPDGLPYHYQYGYEFFRGGKEQYIHNQHGDCGDIKIVFVDDKAENLEAVLALNPLAYCIEMRRRKFYTDPALCKHVHNLNELHEAIMTAGMLKPKTGNAPWRTTSSSRPCTATEHATSPRTSTATEHGTSVPLGPPTGRPMYGEHATSSHSSDDGMEILTLLGDADLDKIVALLLWMSQDFQREIPNNVIHDTALDTLIRCADTPNGDALGWLHTDAVAKLSKTIDIMMLPHPKELNPTPKDANATLAFMRRAARFRDEVIWDTGRHTTTDRVELDGDDVSSCYKRFGRNLITHDLPPHQKQEAGYRLRSDFEGDTQLSGKQRSFVDHMLHKVLGEKKVAYRIWQYGLPSIIDIDMRFRVDVRLLQSSMDECIRWYVSLANDIADYQAQEGYTSQLAASSLDQEEQQRQRRRREALRIARDAMRLGTSLAMQRDNSKRSYNDMDDTEQQIPEDYETGRTKRVKLSHITPRMQGA